MIRRLEREGPSTRPFLEQRDLDLDHQAQVSAHDGMAGGWRSEVLPALLDHLIRPS